MSADAIKSEEPLRMPSPKCVSRHASTCQRSPETNCCIQRSFPQRISTGAARSSLPSAFPLGRKAQPTPGSLGSALQGTSGKTSACSSACSLSGALSKCTFASLGLSLA